MVIVISKGFIGARIVSGYKEDSKRSEMGFETLYKKI